MRTIIGAVIASSILAFGVTSAAKAENVDHADKAQYEKTLANNQRATRNTPIYEPVLGPLYQGRNSPVQKVKRAFQ